MHQNVLNKQQTKMLPMLSKFKQQYCLVGGTAIALQIGHRRSVDFDLFTNQPIDHALIRKTVKAFGGKINQTLIESEMELTLIINQVKFTFYHYPYNLECSVNFKDYINLPKLELLGAMKAFALGKRNVWRDYVDLYYVFNEVGVQKVIDQAKQTFGEEFNLKLFKAQLIYFDDLKHDQPLDFLPGFSPNNTIIKQSLEQVSLSL